MKNLISSTIIFLIIVSCTKPESSDNLHLTGNVKGLRSGVLYIQRVVDTSLVTIDSMQVDDASKFDTTINLKSPEMLYLLLDRGPTNSLDNTILFFAEPGHINIDTSLDSYTTSAKITGSKNQAKYEEYQKINARYRDENLDLIQKKFLALKNGQVAIVESLNAKQENNTKRKYLFATNFAINNRDFEVAPYIALTDIYDINIKYLDTIEKSMTAKVAKSYYGKKLTAHFLQVKNQQ